MFVLANICTFSDVSSFSSCGAHDGDDGVGGGNCGPRSGGGVGFGGGGVGASIEASTLLTF